MFNMRIMHKEANLLCDIRNIEMDACKIIESTEQVMVQGGILIRIPRVNSKFASRSDKGVDLQIDIPARFRMSVAY